MYEDYLDDMEFYESQLRRAGEFEQEYNLRQEFLDLVPGKVEHTILGPDENIALRNSYPEKMPYPNINLLKVMFTPDDRSTIDDGEIHEIKEYDRNGGVVSESNINLGIKTPAFYADHQVTPMEGEVFNVICSLPLLLGYDGTNTFPENCFFDATSIYKYLTLNKSTGHNTKNNHVAPAEILKSIDECIEALENTFVYLDYYEPGSGVHAAYERMLHLRFFEIEVNGVKKKAYHLLSAPLILPYALKTNNISEKNTSQICVCTRYNRKMLDIQSFLFYCVSSEKKKGKNSVEVTYSSIFRNCRIYHDNKNINVRRTEVKRDKDTIIKFLDKWIKTGFITSYEEQGTSKEVRTKIIINF